MLPPGKLSFIFELRKRCEKRREKESENELDTKITKSMIERVYKKENLFKLPSSRTFNKSKKEKQKNNNRSLEELIYKKFHNKMSVGKILQKTAKLQKNIDEKLNNNSNHEDTREILRA